MSVQTVFFQGNRLLKEFASSHELRWRTSSKSGLQDSGVRNPAERFNAGVASTG
ncbi:MAG: hypothetical protein V3T19_11010 [Acidiferrobacterales bacterium]